MSDQAGLFDLPDPVPPRPPTRAGRGRARETFARTITADVSVHDASALRAKALRVRQHSVMIGETVGAEDDDLADLREEISRSAAAAAPWCVEPTMGMGPLLESGAVTFGSTPCTSVYSDDPHPPAFLYAVRWGAVASADTTALQAPFRSGIQIEDHQLDPVVRAALNECPHRFTPT